VSLIEQAAKRLEELRRAGAVTQDSQGTVAGGKSEPASERIPTPEASIRSLDEADTPFAHPRTATIANVPLRDSAAPAARSTRPAIEVDLTRLKELGFVTPDAPKSQIADEFRVIKRPILRNARGAARVPDRTLVMVTSALPGEGKTFTAVNLAMSIAMEVDNTVLLVDGDVAHPSIPDLLGVPRSPGLLDLLTTSDIGIADALVQTNIEKLAILPAGSPHRRATELIASEQMTNLLTKLAHPDRIVIFDSPPLLATTESRVLASNMGQIVMVVASDDTTQHAVKHALAAIESCEIVMMVLNKAGQSDVGAYYGYYPDDDAL